MSITALVSGKLTTDPEKRTGPSGKPFTLARMSAHDGEGHASVSLIAFGAAGRQLAALAKGDALAVNGTAKVNTWQAKDHTTHAGLSVTVDTVLTSYGLKKKRDAVAAAAVTEGEPTPAAAVAAVTESMPVPTGGPPPWDESAADDAWLTSAAAPSIPSNTEGA